VTVSYPHEQAAAGMNALATAHAQGKRALQIA
jgi:hypothetical protein